MKKFAIGLILLSVCMFSFSGCKKDETTSTPPAAGATDDGAADDGAAAGDAGDAGDAGSGTADAGGDTTEGK